MIDPKPQIEPFVDVDAGERGTQPVLNQKIQSAALNRHTGNFDAKNIHAGSPLLGLEPRADQHLFLTGKQCFHQPAGLIARGRLANLQKIQHHRAGCLAFAGLDPNISRRARGIDLRLFRRPGGQFGRGQIDAGATGQLRGMQTGKFLLRSFGESAGEQEPGQDEEQREPANADHARYHLSMPSIETRIAAEHDYPAIARIQQASPEAAQWPVGDYSNYQVLLAFLTVGRNEVAAGFCAWRKTADDETELLNLAVDPAYRRQGVASALLQELAATVKNTILLEVAEPNHAAILVYEKHGWVKVGIRKGYYNQGVVNAIVMEKRPVIKSW